MAKVHFHFKHIIAFLLFLLCFTVLAIVVLNDVFLKKDATEEAPSVPNYKTKKIKNYEVDATIQDVLRAPILDRIETLNEKVIQPKKVIRKPKVVSQVSENPTPSTIPELEKHPIVPDSVPQIVTDAVISNAIPQISQDSGVREDLDGISGLLDPLKIEDDTLDSLTQFVQARQKKRHPRVPNENYYVAAVVDFQPLAIGDILTKVRWNVDQYVEIIAECEKYTVDMVVFPELGIFSKIDTIESILMVAPQIPSTKAGVIPCDVRDYDEILTKLSCAAKSNKMYVAVTLVEKYCAESAMCLLSDLRLYLSTLVFDRNGKIVAKYRKYNSYIERFFPGLHTPPAPELVTFTSDFNVTFGLITGFDIFFKDPAVSLAEKYNVTDIIFPNSLPTRLPFLAVSSVVAGWSYVMGINVLSSKTSDVLGVAGNNIFYGRRELTQTYVTEYGFSSIVIGPVPKAKIPFPRNFANQYVSLMKYSNRNVPISHLKEHVLTSVTMEPLINANYDRQRMFRYVNKDFFCNVSITWEPSFETRALPGYRMAGFNGLTNFTLSSVDNYVEMCGLILCSSITNIRCILPPLFDDPSRVIITSMKIIAASKLSPRDIRIPITLSSDFTVLDPSHYEFSNVIKTVDDEKYNIAEINLKKPISKLVTFGIYKLPEKINPSGTYGVLDVVFNGDTVIG